MDKFKQKLSKRFQSTDPFNFQNWLEYWSKDSLDSFVKNFIHFQSKTTKEFKGQTKKFTDAYYAQKAINHHADQNLPFKTLVLLGEKLGHAAYKEEIEKVIFENVIKSKGVYYKLDDVQNQQKIQKAIKEYQFDECQPIDKAA